MANSPKYLDWKRCAERRLQQEAQYWIDKVIADRDWDDGKPSIFDLPKDEDRGSRKRQRKEKTTAEVFDSDSDINEYKRRRKSWSLKRNLDSEATVVVETEGQLQDENNNDTVNEGEQQAVTIHIGPNVPIEQDAIEQPDPVALRKCIVIPFEQVEENSTEGEKETE